MGRPKAELVLSVDERSQLTSIAPHRRPRRRPRVTTPHSHDARYRVPSAQRQEAYHGRRLQPDQV